MCPSSRATHSVHLRAFPPLRGQERDPACAIALGKKPAAVVPAQGARHAHIRERMRGCRLGFGQSSATPFPPPLWGRDRERGRTALLLAHVYDPISPTECSELSLSSLKRTSRPVHRRHPSPFPSPTRGEGTVRYAPSQLTRCACGERRKMLPFCGDERRVHLS